MYSKTRGVCKVMLTCQSFLTFIRPQQLLPRQAAGAGARRQHLSGVLSRRGLVSLGRRTRNNNASGLNRDLKHRESVSRHQYLTIAGVLKKNSVE